MKKTKVFLSHWFIYLMAFVTTILFLVFPPLFVWGVAYSYQRGNPTATLGILIGVIVFAILAMPMAPLIIWKNLIQWTVIDEVGIQCRNPYKVLRKLAWRDVEGIAIMKLNISSPGSGLKWLVFFEKDKDMRLVNGVMSTDTLISIRYSKKNQIWLSQYWTDPIEEKHFE